VPSAARGQARRRGSGQAIAELAIAAPLLLVVMLVAVDFGRLFFSYIAVQNAAREATSYAAQHAKDTPWDGTAYRASVAGAGAQEPNVQGQGGAGTLAITDPVCFDPQTQVTLDCNVASDFATGIGNQVRVTASQPFAFVTPIVGDLFGGSLTLSATATAPILNPADVDIEPGPSQSAEPSASPEPGASSSPDPSSAPSPSTEPICTVPDFKNQFWNNFGGVPALQVWHDQLGFTGTLENRAGTNRIRSQEIPKKTDVPCSTGMWVDD
jgi:Flp pilus assembly protein TadG